MALRMKGMTPLVLWKHTQEKVNIEINVLDESIIKILNTVRRGVSGYVS